MDVPAQVGPWVVDRVFARGGMGVVAEVHHERDGRSGALKWVGAVSPATLRSFRVEVGALQRLRHPQIVRILDHGQDAGRPWHVMELVLGRPLSHLTQPSQQDADRSTTDFGAAEVWNATPAPSQPVGSSRNRLRFLTAIHSLCRPLAVLHAEGLSHGDLKPENALLGEDGEVVLLDFGLARTFLGREYLELAFRRSGTPGYVAPEVLRGDPVDGRVDLYALGCMLFEGFAGRLPFVGPAQGVTRGHLSLRPPLLSEHSALAPPLLVELVDALLAKEPGLRPAHADEVASALVACGAEELRHPSEPARTYGCLVRSALVGRDRALTEVLAATRVVLVSGPGGIGRTRFLWEVGRRLELTHARHHDLRDHAHPTGALAQLLRSLPEVDPDSPLAELLRPGPQVLVVQDALWRAAAAALTNPGPLWLLVDDLPLADERTIAFVAWAATAGPPGLTIVAAADTHGADNIWAVSRNPAVRVVALEPLDDADALRMAAGLLGESNRAPSPAARAAAAESAGIPAHLALCLRQWLDRGALHRVRGAWAFTPKTVADDAVLDDWLLELASDPLSAVLALLGEPVDEGLLVSLGWDAVLVQQRLFDLGRTGILDGDAPRFASERVRRGLAAAVPSALRRTLSAQILAKLAAPRGVSSAVLADAADALGDPRALDWRLESATEQIAKGAFSEAERTLRRVLQEGVGAQRVQAALQLCRLFGNQRPKEVVEFARTACEVAAAHGLPVPIRVLCYEAYALNAMGDGSAANARLAEALAAVPSHEDAERAMVLTDLSSITLTLGRREEAEAYLHAVEAIGEKAQAGTRAAAMATLGRLRQQQGDPAAALQKLRVALRVLETSSNEEINNRVARAASVLANIGVAQQTLGLSDEGAESWRQGVLLARKSQAVNSLIVLLFNLGQLATNRGDLAEARACLAEALENAEGTNAPVWVALVRLHQFDAELRCGGTPDPDWLDQAEPALVGANLHEALARLWCHRGHLALMRGEDPLPALTRAREAAEPEAREDISRLEQAIASSAPLRTRAAPKTATSDP